MAKKNDKAETTALEITNAALPPELAALAGKYASNAGLEAIDQTDLKRPFYRILQPTSKELLPGNERYIEGASMGQFIEGAITKEVSKEIKIVPIKVVKGWSEFRKQEAGGGFLGFFLDGSDRVEKAIDSGEYEQKTTAEGTMLKRTYQVFSLVDPAAKGRPVLAIFGFSGGSNADVKNFLSYAMDLNLPLFLKEYTLTTYGKFNQAHNSTTFRPDFNVKKSTFVSAEIGKAAGQVAEQLDKLQLDAILNASAEAADAGSDDSEGALDASMG